MFGDPGSLFTPTRMRSQPCSCLTKNDSRAFVESPWQANLGMCHKAKWLLWLQRDREREGGREIERERGEVHTWHSDASRIGQQPASLIVLTQTRIYRNLFWNFSLAAIVHICTAQHHMISVCSVNTQDPSYYTHAKCHGRTHAQQREVADVTPPPPPPPSPH